MSHGGDGYEEKYMPGKGAILHRAKMRAPAWFFAAFALPVLIQIVVIAIVAATVPHFPPGLLALPLAMIPLMFFMALLFAVLRVTVSEDEVHVQYGLFGPKIPVKAIRSAEVVSYDWKQYGGWGIRRGRDGSWAYNMVGDAGRAVKVTWDKDGKEVVHLLVSSDPDALASAIHAAKTPQRLRVASAADPVAEAEQEAEALEAEAEKARRTLD